jgi:hypothetical protein
VRYAHRCPNPVSHSRPQRETQRPAMSQAKLAGNQHASNTSGVAKSQIFLALRTGLDSMADIASRRSFPVAPSPGLLWEFLGAQDGCFGKCDLKETKAFEGNEGAAGGVTP